MGLFTYSDGYGAEFVEAETHEEAMNYFRKKCYRDKMADWEVRLVDTEEVNSMYKHNENEIMRLQKENEKLEKYLF